jgi:hypothetical protein
MELPPGGEDRSCILLLVSLFILDLSVSLVECQNDYKC